MRGFLNLAFKTWAAVMMRSRPTGKPVANLQFRDELLRDTSISIRMLALFICFHPCEKAIKDPGLLGFEASAAPVPAGRGDCYLSLRFAPLPLTSKLSSDSPSTPLDPDGLIFRQMRWRSCSFTSPLIPAS